VRETKVQERRGRIPDGFAVVALVTAASNAAVVAGVIVPVDPATQLPGKARLPRQQLLDLVSRPRERVQRNGRGESRGAGRPTILVVAIAVAITIVVVPFGIALTFLSVASRPCVRALKVTAFSTGTRAKQVVRQRPQDLQQDAVLVDAVHRSGAAELARHPQLRFEHEPLQPEGLGLATPISAQEAGLLA
jgi:hypothetical protein